MTTMNKFPLTALKYLDTLILEEEQARRARNETVFRTYAELVKAGLPVPPGAKDGDLFATLADSIEQVIEIQVQEVSLETDIESGTLPSSGTAHIFKASPFDELLSKPIEDNMERYHKYPELHHTNIVARRLAAGGADSGIPALMPPIRGGRIPKWSMYYSRQVRTLPNIRIPKWSMYYSRQVRTLPNIIRPRGTSKGPRSGSGSPGI